MTKRTRNVKFLSALLCAALALGLLAGCGSEAAQPEMSEVVAAVEAVVPTDGMTQYDANYIKNVFKLEEGDYADCCVMATNVVALSVGITPISPEPMPAPRNGASGFIEISCRRAFSMVVM